jgi:hypothetical protein
VGARGVEHFAWGASTLRRTSGRVADDAPMDVRTPILETVLGTRRTIAGTVYGTILALASLIAGAKLYEHDLWHLAVIVMTTVLVLWVAHVYAHGLGESLAIGRRLTVGELGGIARSESSIPLAAVLPVAALALGAVGVLQERTAIWFAFGIGVATLTLQGVRYAMLERLSRTGMIITIGLNVGLALMIVALKVVAAH